MASGVAREVHEETGRPVTITDRFGNPRWSEVWKNNPRIIRSGGVPVKNGPNCRPYLRSISIERSIFSDWRARDHRGELFLTEDEKERRLDEPYVLIEPNLNKGSNPNKQWGKWEDLVESIETPVQVGPPGTRVLPGARFIETTFREACGVLLNAESAVLPEGGLHQAAGALKKPVVVVFGGFVSPETTGYPESINLFHGPACGKWAPCEHCRAAMERITVKEVMECLQSLLRRRCTADSPQWNTSAAS